MSSIKNFCQLEIWTKLRMWWALFPLNSRCWQNENFFPADVYFFKVYKNTRATCKIWSKLTIKTPEHDMVKQELRVTSYELWIKRLKARVEIQKCEFNPRVNSSNPRVRSSNPQVTSSNPRVMSSNPRVTSSNPRVSSSNARVTS